MKCPECDGVGFFPISNIAAKVCPQCNGTGKIEQTEQNWLQTYSTEEFAEWLLEHMDCIGCPANQEKCQRQYGACKEVIIEWLQQPHKE